MDKFEQQLGHDQAEEEATKMKELIESGKAQNYNEAEAILGKENIRYSRLTPDAAIDFLKTHCIFDPQNVGAEDEIRENFSKANKPEEATYNERAHILFNIIPEEYKDKAGPPSLFLSDFYTVNRYLQMRRGSLTELTEKEKKKLMHNGPFSHGIEIATVIGDAEDRFINFQNLPEETREQIPILMRLRELGFKPMGGFKKILGKIFNGDLEFPDFEKTYLDFLENYLAYMPRFLTLIARDPDWNPLELEEYIKIKGVKNLDYLLSGIDYESPEHDKLFSQMAEKDHFTEEEKTALVEFMEAATDFFGAMREYMEKKIQYNKE